MCGHVPVDAGTPDAVAFLSTSAVGEYGSAPGPISPFVFLVRPDGTATQVTFPDAAGGMVVRLP